ncbi:WD40 repeat-like protein [Backusella circina FSU 941]|nr:WD40 repeat-like protein [Backusella circina FSU 941]
MSGNYGSFEQYTFGSHRSGRPSNKSYHSRINSWSGVSVTSRLSHDSNRTQLVGIHNQLHPPNLETPPHGKSYVKIKTRIKTNKRFTRILLAQTLAVDMTEVYADAHTVLPESSEENPKQPNGSIWTSRFSKDGRYLATAGQNCTIHIWKVLRDPERTDNIDVQDLAPHEPSIKVFHDTPVRTYAGHKADILDLSWSKNGFLLSASMDSTVRLWHISQNVCLCIFRHLDIVTSVRFHPKDDRFFLSGSMDSKLRLWSIPEKRVAFWNEITQGTITAVGFTLDGRTACAGASTGDVFFYDTQGLKYNTQILVKTTRNKKGRKVTGIEPMPGMPPGEERILVTTNDSRIWIINMKDKSFVYKYKGLENSSMQIRASFSDDGRYIICGSEDSCIYLWCTDQVSYSPFHYLQESRLKAAAALGHLGDHVLQTIMQNGGSHLASEYRVTGWLKKGERKVIDKLRSRNEHFVAHQHATTSTIFAPTKTRKLLAKAGGDIIFDHTPVYTHRENKTQAYESSDEDSTSIHRKSRSLASSHRASSSHSNLDDLRRTLREEFEEATPEERDYFDYPDSQIIISADLHGAIKVWRMDSGVYNWNNNEHNNTLLYDSPGSIGSETESDSLSIVSQSSRSENVNNSQPSIGNKKSKRKSTISNFFSKIFDK